MMEKHLNPTRTSKLRWILLLRQYSKIRVTMIDNTVMKASTLLISHLMCQHVNSETMMVTMFFQRPVYPVKMEKGNVAHKRKKNHMVFLIAVTVWELVLDPSSSGWNRMFQEINVHSIASATEVDDCPLKETSVHFVRSLRLGFVIIPAEVWLHCNHFFWNWDFSPRTVHPRCFISFFYELILSDSFFPARPPAPSSPAASPFSQGG